MLGDRVVASIGVEDLALLIDPHAVRRHREVAPIADLLAIAVQHHHVAHAATTHPDRPIRLRIANPGVDPPLRIDRDVRHRSPDLSLGPALHQLVLITPEPEPLRHDNLPANLWRFQHSSGSGSRAAPEVAWPEGCPFL